MLYTAFSRIHFRRAEPEAKTNLNSSLWLFFANSNINLKYQQGFNHLF